MSCHNYHNYFKDPIAFVACRISHSNTFSAISFNRHHFCPDHTYSYNMSRLLYLGTFQQCMNAHAFAFLSHLLVNAVLRTFYITSDCWVLPLATCSVSLSSKCCRCWCAYVDSFFLLDFILWLGRIYLLSGYKFDTMNYYQFVVVSVSVIAVVVVFGIVV